MNYKQYYERESKKTYWRLIRDHNNRLFPSPKREYVKNAKKQAIRSNFEVEITKKANPSGWNIVAGTMSMSALVVLTSLVLLLLTEFNIIYPSSNYEELLIVLLVYPTISLMLTSSMLTIITRRRRK